MKIIHSYTDLKNSTRFVKFTYGVLNNQTVVVLPRSYISSADDTEEAMFDISAMKSCLDERYYFGLPI